MTKNIQKLIIENFKDLAVEKKWNEFKEKTILLDDSIKEFEKNKESFTKEKGITLLKNLLGNKKTEEVIEQAEKLNIKELKELIKEVQFTAEFLAAGFGTRYSENRLKQLEAIGPNGECLIEYTVYDNITAGCTKVVFTIRKEIEEDFKNSIGKRIEKVVKVEYKYQDMKDVPENVEVPKDRTKPLGTSHALWCTREALNGKFAIFSADDFYGREAIVQAVNHARNSDDYAIIGYKIGDTLSENGAVKRGVCIEEDGKLKRIVESKVERIDGKIVCSPLNGEPSFTVSEDHPVSMLLFTVDKRVIDEIGKEMPIEAKQHQDEMDDYEFLFPDTIDKMMQEGKIKVQVVPTDSKWHGITYKEDLENLKNSINKAIEKGIYPKNLWEGSNESEDTKKKTLKRS